MICDTCAHEIRTVTDGITAIWTHADPERDKQHAAIPYEPRQQKT